MGTRDQPLMVALTTAGNDPGSMAAEEHLHSESVLANPALDPSRFVVIRNTPTDADWKDEKNWHHANPALGDFLRIQILRDEVKEAEQSPRKQNAVRQFRLNQWVRQVTRWLDMGVWDENVGRVRPSQLEGKPCYAGLDMASTSDFAAWVLVFPNLIRPESENPITPILAHLWLPEAAVNARRDMRDLLFAWRDAGHLTITLAPTWQWWRWGQLGLLLVVLFLAAPFGSVRSRRSS